MTLTKAMTKEQALERARRWEATHSRRFDATYAKGSSTPEDAEALAYIEKALDDYERDKAELAHAKEVAEGLGYRLSNCEAAVIRAALEKQGPQAGYCEICKGTGEVDGPLEGQRLPCPGPKHRPAPTIGEREEMLEIIDSKMSALVSRYGWLRLGDLKRNESGNPINREYETLNKIRALIESSGGEKHPLVKLVENMVDMTPEQHRAANDCLRELIHGEPAPSPGPSAKAVEEAMFRMEMFANCHGSKDEVADAAVLKAALSAKEK